MSYIIPDWPVEDDVHVGFWTNASRGALRSFMLTLDQKTGGYMIAFVALFVGATARSAWKIMRYLLHGYYASARAHDGVHHQRQAILRNTNIATDTALQLMQARYVWRNRAQKPWGKTILALMLATIVAVGSSAAGKFLDTVLPQDID